MALLLSGSSATCFGRHRLSTRAPPSRVIAVAHRKPESSKHRKKPASTVTSAGSALGGLTFSPVQRPKKSSSQPWTPGLVCNEQGCHYKADSDTLAWLKDLFDDIDADKDGAITKHDLRGLLQKTNSYLEPAALDWLSEAGLGESFSKYDADSSGDISFDEFIHMFNDGGILAVTLAKYKLIFDEVDTSGNGTLGAAEVEHFFHKIGQPFAGPQELHKLFQQYDTNSSGQLEFNEFLVLFKDRLRDLKKTLANISMKPAKSKALLPSVIEVTPGEVHHIYNDQEFDHVLKMHADQLVVVCASSTDCVPCKSFEPAFKRFASVYRKVVFLHFYAESNEMTKYLDQVKLKVERHPHFAMFRQGEQKFWFTGANAENFEASMQRTMLPEENPASGLGSFALRAHRARVGLTRS